MLSRRWLVGTAAVVALRPHLALAEAAPSGAEASGSTLERIQRSKTLRLAAFPGEAPFYAKDSGSGGWSGTAIEMAKDIAATCEVKLELVESTLAAVGGELQAGKIDLAIGVVPAPKWALLVDFTRPFFRNAVGIIGRKGFHAGSWAELDKPEIKIAIENGSPQEATIKRFAPNATIIGFKKAEDALGAVGSGRADAGLTTAVAGVSAIKRNAQLGEFQVLHQPRLDTPIAMAVRSDADHRWRDFLDVWIDYNNGNQRVRDWLAAGLGIKPDELPPDLGL